MSEMKKHSSDFYFRISELLKSARKNVVQAVNSTMVVTYFEIGRLIVVEEQKGKERAEYGKQIIKELSSKLSNEFGKGFSQRNLEQMRQFYLTYSKAQTLSAESRKDFPAENLNQNRSLQLTYSKGQMLSDEFKLSWSHYLLLMRIDNVAERKFYEIEAYENTWSLRELQRQFDSSLYERLALSRDKKAIKKLSEKGLIIEKAQDTLKDPYVLEFLGLPEETIYSETDLEQKLIDKLEHFLLELGKGFTYVGRQLRFTFDDKHFRVDLVFYNRLLQCFVLIDLKIGEITHQNL